mmetsp:Transcript_18475/g.38179  ORF Transcript_18475/g.38179 Transcript_18475/m.38179 type:complete len:318 (-) Transcript_18475:1574-2527(-)
MACAAQANKNDDDDEEDAGGATTEADFLSSIEICSVLRSDVLLMQNWDHVNDILKLLNLNPKNSNNTDFARVRNYMLTGHAAHWRQLIMTSQFTDPMILSSFKRYAKSIAGLARVRRRTASLDQASISQVIVNNVRQVFQRVPCRSLVDQNKDRLSYFADKILPDISRRKHTMIFLPSYFDFVAVRNLLLKREVSFVSVTEYARASEVSRGRARFLQGHKPILLYTGRAHFFLRHLIRGVRHLIFYSIPEYSEFFTYHVNNLANGNMDDENNDMDASERSCLALYTKYDSHALERVVGQSNCKRMVGGEKSTYLFDT